MPTEEEVATALKALLDTALASYGAVSGAVKALDYDDAQKTTAEHLQTSLSRRFSAAERAGRESQSPWRYQTRPVSDTISNGREIGHRCFLALSGVRVTAGGQTSTPIRLESADDIGPDNGKFSGLTTWTFTF